MTSLLFTVFTPTYNRAHTLHRVMESLERQTVRNFEWVIVDDGSTDGTAALVEEWKARADFDIHYRSQKNQGKHIAINAGLEQAQGALFLIIDSDDAFLPDSLEMMAALWAGIEDQSAYTGIVTLSQNSEGVIDGVPFPRSPLDTDALELDRTMRSNGERWGFHRTDIMRRFHFPFDADVRFVPENIIWYAIARHYRLRGVNVPLRVYTSDSNNQLTKSSLNTRASVYRYYYMIYFGYFDFFRRDPGYFVKMALLYWRYRCHMRTGGVGPVRALCAHLGAPVHERSVVAQFLFLLAAVPGFGLFLADRLRGRRVIHSPVTA